MGSDVILSGTGVGTTVDTGVGVRKGVAVGVSVGSGEVGTEGASTRRVVYRIRFRPSK